MSYFKQFPTIFYNGHQCKNLLTRAKLTDQSKKDLQLYYPYTIKESDGRAELISDYYYSDPYAVWMIYFANEVVDPYFDLGLNQQDFDSYITKKYGSVANAQSHIAFYRTNWELLEDSSIFISEYESLSAEEKYYWEPVLDVYGNLNKYRRKKEDQIVNTNRMFELTIENSLGEFKSGERIEANSSIYGYVVNANNTHVLIQHVTGVNTSNIVDQTVIGKESGTTASVSTSNLICENISANVQMKYWTSVSHYDNETEVNALKRNIQLIDTRYKSKIEDDLKKIMRN